MRAGLGGPGDTSASVCQSAATEKNITEKKSASTQRPSAGKLHVWPCVYVCARQKVAFGQNLCCQISGIFSTVSSITSNTCFKQA